MKAALLVVCLAVIGAGTLTAQSSVPMPTRTVCGVVHGTDARPLDAANVFLIETLEGVVTHEDGRFTIQTTATGPLTIIVHRLGFSERRRLIAEGDTSTPVITLEASGVSLAPVAVQAGQCTAGEERGATLTPLETRWGASARMEIVTAPRNGFLVRITVPAVTTPVLRAGTGERRLPNASGAVSPVAR